MTHAEYLKTLKKLGLSSHSNATCDALGLKQAQVARLAAGKAKVNRTLELLLKMYLRFGVPRGI